jgi:hypothetical protein
LTSFPSDFEFFILAQAYLNLSLLLQEAHRLWLGNIHRIQKMGGLKSYFHPVRSKGRDGKNGASKTQPVPMEMTTTPPRGSLNIPGRNSLTRSRRSSQYPQGDFRNSAIEEVLDIKSDIMVNFLHQQQMERLWTSHMPSEGVVLKKSRGNYTCSPYILRREIGGLFDQVVTMNVKVITSIQLYDC